MLRSVCAAAMLAALGVVCHAQTFNRGFDQFTVRQFLDWDEKAATKLGPAMYVMGYIEANISTRNWLVAMKRAGNSPPQIPMACPPQGVTPTQALAVVKKSLMDKPEHWHEPASTHVFGALLVAWPCPDIGG